MKKFSKALLIFILIIFVTANGQAFAEDYSCGFLLPEKVFLGGFPVGLSTLGEGLYVDDIATVITEKGAFKPLDGVGISKGDILLTVNGSTVNSRDDVARAVKKGQDNELVFSNGNGKYTVKSPCYRDINLNTFVLGLFLSDGIDGIGTVTFITESGTFSALGHPIQNEGGTNVLINNGCMYKCNIEGVTPSAPNAPGKLNGDFTKEAPIGIIDRNTDYGAYGKMLTDAYSTITISTQSRILASLGKAQIYTTLHGSKPDYYDVEILSLSLQPKIKEKGILLKATDERLLAIGGITRGMSGSPIIQNGKLIGAVTHVMVGDTHKGYGIYSDFLFEIAQTI